MIRPKISNRNDYSEEVYLWNFLVTCSTRLLLQNFKTGFTWLPCVTYSGLETYKNVKQKLTLLNSLFTHLISLDVKLDVKYLNLMWRTIQCTLFDIKSSSKSLSPVLILSKIRWVGPMTIVIQFSFKKCFTFFQFLTHCISVWCMR